MSLFNSFILALPLKFNETDDESSAHQIFIKKHRSEKKSSDKPAGKTLTVLNLPPYVTEEALTRVFSIAGPVEKVTLIDSYKNADKSKYQIKSAFFEEKIPFKFLIGFIVFRKSESVDVIFRLKSLPPINTEEAPVLQGIAKWTAEYNKRTVNIDDMQKDIDEYMKHYDKVKKLGDMQDVADDDGWVTVGKKEGFKQKESVVSKLEEKIQNQKKKAKSMSGFYTFEMRESKKQQLIDLRSKFEQDKLKMQSLKLNRKFKPY